MDEPTCLAPDCDRPRPRKHKGQRNPYCTLHRHRLRATGRVDLKTAEERYEEKVDRSGGPDACHPWRRARNAKDYGLFARDGDTLAVRWAYKRFIGPLADDEVVRHTCDNPPCQNRRHWIIGKPIDNTMDKVARGRQHRPRGERNVKAKLTAIQVAEIRSQTTGALGEQARFAQQYRVSPATINHVLRGRTWSA